MKKAGRPARSSGRETGHAKSGRRPSSAAAAKSREESMEKETVGAAEAQESVSDTSPLKANSGTRSSKVKHKEDVSATVPQEGDSFSNNHPKPDSSVGTGKTEEATVGKDGVTSSTQDVYSPASSSRPVRSSFWSALTKMSRRDDTDYTYAVDSSRKKKETQKEKPPTPEVRQRKPRQVKEVKEEKISEPAVVKEQNGEVKRERKKKEPPVVSSGKDVDPRATPELEKRLQVQMKDDHTAMVNAEELSKLFDRLEDYQRQIHKLQDQLKAQLEGGDVSPEGRLSLLGDVERPAVNMVDNYVCAKGFRLIDLETLRVALGKAQDCGCASSGARLSLLELEAERVHEDLATHLSFVCSTCEKATVFPNSPYSESLPANYSVNKHLMTRLGPTAYLQLAQFLQTTESAGLVTRQPGQPAQLVLSIDKNDFVPHQDFKTHLQSSSGIRNGGTTVVMEDASSLMQNTYVPFRPSRPFIPGVPPGSLLSQVPPGARISGEISYTTPEISGLHLGVFRIIHNGYFGRHLFLAVQKNLPFPAANPLMPALPFPPPTTREIYTGMVEDEETTEEEEDDDDCGEDMPDISDYLEVSVSDERNADVTADTIDASDRYLGWQDDDERRKRGAPTSDGDDSDYDPYDDKELRKRQRRKRKTT